LIGTEVRERVSIKPRQAVSRAEPEKPARVPDDLVYFVVGQAIGGGVVLEWQAPGKDTSGESDKQAAV